MAIDDRTRADKEGTLRRTSPIISASPAPLRDVPQFGAWLHHCLAMAGQDPPETTGASVDVWLASLFSVG